MKLLTRKGRERERRRKGRKGGRGRGEEGGRGRVGGREGREGGREKSRRKVRTKGWRERGEYKLTYMYILVYTGLLGCSCTCTRITFNCVQVHTCMCVNAIPHASL